MKIDDFRARTISSPRRWPLISYMSHKQRKEKDGTPSPTSISSPAPKGESTPSKRRSNATPTKPPVISPSTKSPLSKVPKEPTEFIDLKVQLNAARSDGVVLLSPSVMLQMTLQNGDIIKLQLPPSSEVIQPFVNYASLGVRGVRHFSLKKFTR